MTIHIVRLGSPRLPNEGLRIGTVRRPPRGVKKEDFAAKDFYDVWFPNLAPSEALLKEGQAANDEKTWKTFTRKFLAELKDPLIAKDLDLLVALSHHTNISIGCYCEMQERCHRSILKTVLLEKGANVS